MPKRFFKRLSLEQLLLKINPHPKPRPNLEQYTISADVAATMLYIAAYKYDSVIEKTVLDLGCGTGRLALGAAYLGARRVVALDIDRTAVKVAIKNSEKVHLKKKVEWIIADIDAVFGTFDTVFQNPPVGVQKRGSDCRFLKVALKSGKKVFSLHKKEYKKGYKKQKFIKRLYTNSRESHSLASSEFIINFIENNGGRIKEIYNTVMTIPHMFSFHTKIRYKVPIDLYILEGIPRSVD